MDFTPRNVPVTTTRDVIDLFCTTQPAETALSNWRNDPYYTDHVVPHVERHEAKALYKLTPADVASVCETTFHALGNVRRADGESIAEIVNWHPAFAVTAVLHHYVEVKNSLPKWEDFLSYYRNDPLGRQMLGVPIEKMVAKQIAEGKPEALVDAAMHWRIGNFYYSFLREIWLLTRLRDAGLDVRMHPLADALFRVDAWFERTALVIYIGNKSFREGMRGRKVHTEKLLHGAEPRFTVREIYLKPATVYGKVHLPSEEALATIIDDLQYGRQRPPIKL